MKKDMKLIMESWRSFKALLNEQEVAPDPVTAQKVDQIIKLPYEQFVDQFKNIAADPKVQAVLNYGLKDGAPDDEKVSINRIKANVKQLLPTQNEIDIDKSLAYPLKDVNTFNTYKKGGLVAPGGKQIVTANGGKLIIDGHHRWSQVYCINPNTQIDAIDITLPGADAFLYLKIVQLAIAANIQKIPTAKVDGNNLLAADVNVISEYVKGKASPEVIQAGGGLENLQKLIIVNSDSMKKSNQPVKGAPKRDVMPQTDDAPQWTNAASSGQLNFKNTGNIAGQAAAAPVVKKPV